MLNLLLNKLINKPLPIIIEEEVEEKRNRNKDRKLFNLLKEKSFELGYLPTPDRSNLIVLAIEFDPDNIGFYKSIKSN